MTSTSLIVILNLKPKDYYYYSDVVINIIIIIITTYYCRILKFASYANFKQFHVLLHAFTKSMSVYKSFFTLITDGLGNKYKTGHLITSKERQKHHWWKNMKKNTMASHKAFYQNNLHINLLL